MIEKKETDNNKSDIAKTNNNTQTGKGKLLKKQKITIIVLVCVISVLVSVIVPLCVFFVNRSYVPVPYVSNFNDETDFYIRIRWNKINGAKSYSYQYCYDEPNKVTTFENGLTENTQTSLLRHKGTVYFRVKANMADEKAIYSDWLSINVSPWELSPPVVTLTDTLQMSWSKSGYMLDDGMKDVIGYQYNFYIDEEPCFLTDSYTKVTDLSATIGYCINAIKDTDKIIDYELAKRTDSPVEWQDIKFELWVKAVTYTTWAGTAIVDPQGDEAKLSSIYNDSEYAKAELIITEEIYNNLMEQNQ